MELLDIKIKPFTRMQYASKEIMDEWQPKIDKASKVYNQLEFLTVKYGVRKCMIHHSVNPHEIIGLTQRLAKDGMFLIPLAKEGVRDGDGFSHSSSAYNGNGKFVYRSVISKSLEDAYEFVKAHNNRDDVKIGELLGFPKCCSKFFDEVWKKGYIDPIWQQAENTDGNVYNKLLNKNIIKLSDSNPFTLSVFRYIGIRFQSHFSCSMDCKHSEEYTEKWIDLAKKLNLNGVHEMLEIMQLPFEWSCYKGVAIVNTPIFKIVTDSVPCYPEYTIQKEGKFYPKNAPNGVKFPWRINKEGETLCQQ